MECEFCKVRLFSNDLHTTEQCGHDDAGNPGQPGPWHPRPHWHRRGVAELAAGVASYSVKFGEHPDILDLRVDRVQGCAGARRPR